MKLDLREAIRLHKQGCPTQELGVVPATDIPVEWNPFRPWAEQRVFMKPQEFLDLVTDPYSWDEGSITSIQEGLTSGHSLHALMLEIDVDTLKVEGHEGRHRAYYAMEAGIPCVPVAIIHRRRNSEGFLRDTPVQCPVIRENLKTESGRPLNTALVRAIIGHCKVPIKKWY